MAHILTTYDAEGTVLSVVTTNDRQRAFSSYDQFVALTDFPGGRITLTGDGLSKEHVFPEAPDEDREAPKASGGAGERAGGAPDDSGKPAPAPQAAPPPAKQPEQPKSKSGKAKSGALTSH